MNIVTTRPRDITGPKQQQSA